MKKLTLKEMAIDAPDYIAGRSLKRFVEKMFKDAKVNRNRGVSAFLKPYGFTLSEDHEGHYSHGDITAGLIPEVAAFTVVAREKRLEFEKQQAEQKETEKAL